MQVAAMSDERLATIEAQCAEIGRVLTKLDAKMDLLQAERTSFMIDLERLKNQVKLITGALGIALLGGGGAGAVLQFLGK